MTSMVQDLGSPVCYRLLVNSTLQCAVVPFLFMVQDGKCIQTCSRCLRDGDGAGAVSLTSAVAAGGVTAGAALVASTDDGGAATLD